PVQGRRPAGAPGRRGEGRPRGAELELPATGPGPAGGHFVRLRLELVGQRLERHRFATGAVRERLRKKPIGEPPVPRPQRPVEIRAEQAPGAAALVAALAVVPEAGEDATERLGSRIEARATRVVLEAGERPSFARLELTLEEHITDHALFASDGLER